MKSISIDRIEVSVFTIPTDFPEADGTLKWDKTTVVVVKALAAGLRSLGYTYADGRQARRGSESVKTLIHDLIVIISAAR
ncbi:MAG TPA: hypothetical protein VEZ90_03920 [Blastocatellia bacterium]|nr:hypothetical protein [Blastocatellia bacterium]